MALITCPECNGMVSDEAIACPHCGYPIKEHALELCTKSKEIADIPQSDQAESLYESEVKRLTDKIRKVEYTVPSPRAKVCIKCGKFFGYYADPNDKRHGIPRCKCLVDGKHLPGYDVDYPQQQATSVYAERYIWDKCVIPMNIGDKDSPEYLYYKKKVLTRKDPEEIKRKKSLGEPTKHIRRPPAELPSKEWFGRTSGTPHEELMKKRWEEFDRKENARMQISKQIPHCPFCQSTDLTKISELGKVAKIWAFGIFGMDDTGKTYRCNNCGGKF